MKSEEEGTRTVRKAAERKDTATLKSSYQQLENYQRRLELYLYIEMGNMILKSRKLVSEMGLVLQDWDKVHVHVILPFLQEKDRLWCSSVLTCHGQYSRNDGRADIKSMIGIRWILCPLQKGSLKRVSDLCYRVGKESEYQLHLVRIGTVFCWDEVYFICKSFVLVTIQS